MSGGENHTIVKEVEIKITLWNIVDYLFIMKKQNSKLQIYELRVTVSETYFCYLPLVKQVP